MGLNIPMLIECYNNNKVSRAYTSSMRIDGLPLDKRPAACIGCGACTHACPQGIDVPAVMTELADMYENGPHWAEVKGPRSEDIRRDLHMD